MGGTAGDPPGCAVQTDTTDQRNLLQLPSSHWETRPKRTSRGLPTPCGAPGLRSPATRQLTLIARGSNYRSRHYFRPLPTMYSFWLDFRYWGFWTDQDGD